MRGVLGAEHGQGGGGGALAMEVDQRPQVEVSEVVGIAGQKEVLTLDPLPVHQESPGTAQEGRLEKGVDNGGSARPRRCRRTTSGR